jgi:hypothetical protein
MVVALTTRSSDQPVSVEIELKLAVLRSQGLPENRSPRIVTVVPMRETGHHLPVQPFRANRFRRAVGGTGGNSTGVPPIADVGVQTGS